MVSFKLLYSGHFYFTKLLLPTLISGAQSSSDGKARVVTLSSLAAYFSPRLDLDLTRDSELNKKRKKTSGMTLYGHSKLVCIHFRLHPFLTGGIRFLGKHSFL